MKKSSTSSEDEEVTDFGFGPRKTINNDISLCDVDIQVCCKPLPDMPKQRDNTESVFTSEAPKKCGVHNKEGIGFGRLDVFAKNPEKFTTHFGEWPHHCIIFQSGIYRGGASMIAPGVILTAAHKIW